MRSLFAALVALVVLALPASSARAEPCRAPVVVEGHGVPAEVTRELEARAPALFDEVARELRLTSCDPVRVALLPALEEAAHLDPPWVLPEWAAGAAVPHERRIVVAVTARGQRQDRERVLLHELAHVGIREAAGDAPVPRWLDEGFARVMAREHSVDDLGVLARARVADRLFPLAALTDGFPARADLAALAYAEAGRAVSLIQGADDEAMSRVLAGLAAGGTVDDALASATGRRTWQLDLDVERSIPLWRAWSIVGLETDAAYAAAALVCAWAGRRARRRIRERMAALDGLDGLDALHAPDLARPWRLDPLEVGLRRWTVATPMLRRAAS
jgi:hypothetical protein